MTRVIICTIFVVILATGNLFAQYPTPHYHSKWGFVDTNGKVVIKHKYYDAGNFSEDLARVLISVFGELKKWGFIDINGKVVIKAKYEDAGNFSEGLARVKDNKRWGYIDKNGDEIVPFMYDIANDFTEGIAKVKLNGKWILINKAGEELSSLKYENLENEIIWENILLSNINQINDYHQQVSSPLKFGTRDFNINRPYLLITMDNITKNIKIDEYSEGDFNEQSIIGLKTLIIKYDVSSEENVYQGTSNQGTYQTNYFRKVYNKRAILIYFNMESKEFFGYDKMNPQIISDFNSLSKEEILQKIASHLTGSE